MQSDSKYPPLVYKYRNWVDQYQKDLLLKNQLYFTSPKDINDPFDCKIPENYSLLDTDDKIKFYIDKKRQEIQNEYSLTGKNLEKILDTFKSKLKSEPDQVQKRYNDLYFDGIGKYFGILSLSERWDSILMWSHYADNHKGYCIGFWEEKLRNSFEATGGRVIYPSQNDFPIIDPLDFSLQSIILLTHTKSNEWSYEKEYRQIKIFFPNEANHSDRIQPFTNDFISEIIIGLNAPPETREEVIQIGKQKNIPIFQALKKPFKFEIIKKLIT